MKLTKKEKEKELIKYILDVSTPKLSDKESVVRELNLLRRKLIGE